MIKFIHKLTFAIILGIASVMFAEVFVSSFFPFFSKFGIVFILPLYFLHILFFATLVARKKENINWPKLYFAGVLFGLYEAFITKQLWNPDWGNSLLTYFEVDWIATLVLAFFWHPFMAFILPLVVVEVISTKPPYRIWNVIPEIFRDILNTKKYLFTAALFFGVIAGVLLPPEHILSPVSSTLFFLIALVLTKLILKKRYELAELLPGKMVFIGITVLLVLYYIITTSILRVEAFPVSIGYVAILALYAVVIFLFNRTRKSSASPLKQVAPELNLNLVVAASLVFTVSTVAFSLLLHGFSSLIAIAWAVYVTIAIGTLIGIQRSMQSSSAK